MSMFFVVPGEELLAKPSVRPAASSSLVSQGRANARSRYGLRENEQATGETKSNASVCSYSTGAY